MMTLFSVTVSLLLTLGVESFLSSQAPTRASVLNNGRSSGDGFSLDTLQKRLEKEQHHEFMEALFETSLTEMKLVGETRLKTASEGVLQDCVVLTTTTSTFDVSAADAIETTAPCFLVPVSPPQRTLLQFAAWNQPQSKWIMISSLNPLLVNRDGALFDNLPWASWTVDPQRRNRDAAGNVVAAKYHLGKRDAYNRFLGKDWAGSATSMSVFQELVAEQSTAEQIGSTEGQKGVANGFDSDVLASRILEIQFREAQMSLAEIESELAVAVQQGGESVVLERKRDTALQELQELQRRGQQASKVAGAPIRPNLMDRGSKPVASTTDNPPYRGASGYVAKSDPPTDSETKYCSPYDLLKEILEDQMQAEVVGATLENTGIMQTTVGGALVLKRISAKDSILIAGETLTVENPLEDYGNPEIVGDTNIIVECDADEAVGMALACGLPLKIESDLAEKGTAMLCRAPGQIELVRPATYKTALDSWDVVNDELTILQEGQSLNKSKSGQVLAIRSQRSTSLFDAIIEAQPSRQKSSVFPTDNPVKSLEQFDSLSILDKARTLQSSSNFNGRLPRPRAIREKPAALDALLLPLIDESVRRQYMIRDARRRGDTETATQLESRKSPRQNAKEMAASARDNGQQNDADFWENEFEFLETLRADPTQDEGSYSQWLDRDEWYERERLKLSRRIDKSKFGTLLDGIDL